MLCREFGTTGDKVSAIGLGTWNIGHQWGDIDETTAFSIIDAALEHGMTLIDTADVYGVPHGLVEERLGKALTGRRHRLHLVSKIGNWGRRTGQMVPFTTADMVRLCGHAILHRLHTDWIDTVLCHHEDPTAPEVFLEGFEALNAEGRVRHYGISTRSLDVLKRFNCNGTCSVTEVDYSLLNRAPERDGYLDYCRDHGIAVLIRGPLFRGLLSGRFSKETKFADSVRSSWHKDENAQSEYEANIERVERLKAVLQPGEDLATMALRFTISHEMAPAAIPGATSTSQVGANAMAGERALTAEEMDRLLTALDP